MKITGACVQNAKKNDALKWNPSVQREVGKPGEKPGEKKMEKYYSRSGYNLESIKMACQRQI